jgi:hypothetical protein
MTAPVLNKLNVETMAVEPVAVTAPRSPALPTENR